MYQALYRKYRPQTFDDVIGQGHVTATLTREVAEGRVAHAYLFAGPRGTGKTTTARILAKALNCEKRGPDGSPDNTCVSCVAITEGTSLDVLELDAASHNSVDDIRDMRVSVSTVAASPTSKRVFILDEVHMLSKAAGNALLKTLEEPPEHVHFVLATTEPYKLLDTIRSRAQRFDFHPIGAEALAGHLARIADLEGYQAGPDALLAVARHAGGSVRDALSLLEQVAALGNGTVDGPGVRRALGMAEADSYLRLAEAVRDADATKGLGLIAELAAEGVDLRRFAAEAITFFRGVFLTHYAPNLAEISDEPSEVLDSWRRAAAMVGPGEVLRCVDVLGEALLRLREGREERLMVELAVIRLTRPETSEDQAALLARLERLERGAAAPGRSPSPPPTAASSDAATPSTASAASPGTHSAAPAAPPGTPSAAPAAPPPTLAPLAGGGHAPLAGGGHAPLDGEKPSNGGLTFERVQEVWPSVFGGMRDLLGPRRWALFRETTPGGVEGSTILLNVGHDFHLEALRQDPAVTALVATRAGDLLGIEVTIDFRSTSQPAAEEELPELDKDSLFDGPESPSDPVDLLKQTLGATVVEEVDEPE
jgi:DNA polymerase-3 subunit gamma/tau